MPLDELVLRHHPSGSTVTPSGSAPAAPSASLPSQSPPSQAALDRLFIRWQRDHDQRAREQLVGHYLPLAMKLARRYRGAHEPPEDLRQVASVGLLNAIDRHDPSRGTSFRSFAVPTILGEIKRYFRDCGWAVHVPRATQDLALKVERAERELTAAHGRPPTLQALAEYLELPLEQVCDAAEAAGAHHAISFDTPHDDGEGDVSTLGDSVGEVDDHYEQVEDKACIAEAARELLTERERRVLAMRFLEDRTQSQIAAEIGVSQMQVSRIIRGALGRLSDAVEPDGLQ